MVLAWAALVVVGLAISVLSSGRALHTAEALGHRAGLPPHIIGLTIVAIGTDLPEIANSISASAAGRGDLNVGDSTGSAATQITLVLGVLCLLRPLRVDRRFVALAGSLTVGAFILGAWLMSNGTLSRLDGALLVCGWVGATALIKRLGTPSSTSASVSTSTGESTGESNGEIDEPTATEPAQSEPGIVSLTIRTLLALGVVAAGAVLAVTAFGHLVDDLGVPEYATSFLVLAVGTSLPELIVDSHAVVRGMGALALGGVLGSSLIDATLSLGIGPLLFPTAVSPEAARGTLMVGAVVAAAVLLLLRTRTHGKATGFAAIALYLALFPIVIL